MSRRGAGFSGVDVSRFNAMVLELKQKTGASIASIVESEVRSTLEAALKTTKAAKVATIKRNQETQQWVTVNGKRMRRDWRMKDATYAEAKRKHGARTKILEQARGLSKRQVLDMAASVGLNLRGTPAYVRAARASAKAHRNQKNTTGRREIRPFRYVLAMRLDYPLAFLPTVGIQRALNRAIQGRVKFFKRNAKEGVFDSAAATVAKYGGFLKR